MSARSFVGRSSADLQEATVEEEGDRRADGCYGPPTGRGSDEEEEDQGSD
jgi:hypothetical protein